MKTSVIAGWIVTILVSTIIFSFIAVGSDDWGTYSVLVQEAVYEAVPSSQTRINAVWVGSATLSTLIGVIIGSFIYSVFRDEEKKHE